VGRRPGSRCRRTRSGPPRRCSGHRPARPGQSAGVRRASAPATGRGARSGRTGSPRPSSNGPLTITTPPSGTGRYPSRLARSAPRPSAPAGCPRAAGPDRVQQPRGPGRPRRASRRRKLSGSVRPRSIPQRRRRHWLGPTRTAAGPSRRSGPISWSAEVTGRLASAPSMATRPGRGGRRTRAASPRRHAGADRPDPHAVIPYPGGSRPSFLSDPAGMWAHDWTTAHSGADAADIEGLTASIRAHRVEVIDRADDWITIETDAGQQIAFQLAPDQCHRSGRGRSIRSSPSRPDGQRHRPAAERAERRLGATPARPREAGSRWPTGGHPFDLCQRDEQDAGRGCSRPPSTRPDAIGLPGSTPRCWA